MKKVLLLAVLLVPCVPSFIAGVQSQRETNEDRRQAMLEQRFERWCVANGRPCDDVTYLDFWTETDDYCAACDSIDNVLSIKNIILNNP